MKGKGISLLRYKRETHKIFRVLRVNFSNSTHFDRVKNRECAFFYFTDIF
jgi:hypothetical protein